jgi:hypothetical protein
MLKLVIAATAVPVVATSSHAFVHSHAFLRKRVTTGNTCSATGTRPRARRPMPSVRWRNAPTTSSVSTIWSKDSGSKADQKIMPGTRQL